MIWSAFILGLVGSWHCIGMCGPIALMIPGGRGNHRILSILLYHSGKILAYISIGALIGSISIFITSFKIQAIITIGVGLLMAIFALIPALLNRVERKGYQFFTPLIRIKNQLAKALNKKKIEYSFYIGFLNGFIPCGMVYVAALGSLTQPTFVEGMLFMFFFGIGTMPFMSLLIYASSYFQTRFKRYAIPLRTAAFIMVSIFMIWRGVSDYNTALHLPKLGENYMICD